MKLRNKKTYEIYEINDDECSLFTLLKKTGLFEDWEIIEEKEPLVEDKKIRSVLAKWFNLLRVKSVIYKYEEDCLVYNANSNSTYNKRDEVKISFNSWSAFKNLEDGKIYTREQLCGEEDNE